MTPGEQRPIGPCAKCGEVRDMAADGLCYRCYRARGRQQEREEAVALLRWAEIPAERHNSALLKEQKRLRKAVVGILNLVDDAGDLFAEEDRVLFRDRLRPYVERLARALTAPTTADPKPVAKPNLGGEAAE